MKRPPAAAPPAGARRRPPARRPAARQPHPPGLRARSTPPGSKVAARPRRLRRRRPAAPATTPPTIARPHRPPGRRGRRPPASSATSTAAGSTCGPSRLDAEGQLRREAIRIGTPRAANCAACHGLVVRRRRAGGAPGGLRGGRAGARRAPGRLTQGEGAIVAPQRMADSFLEPGGQGAASPRPGTSTPPSWSTASPATTPRNNPGPRPTASRPALRYLTADPRRPSTGRVPASGPTTGWPSRTAAAATTPLKAHDFLPYRERHMAVLACQACHARRARWAPAAEMVDATVVTRGRRRRPSRYRNVERRAGRDAQRRHHPAASAAARRAGRGATACSRLAPVNLVSRYRWVSGPDRRRRCPSRRWRRPSSRAAPTPPRSSAAFDANRDGRLDERELRLDTPAKTELVAARLPRARRGRPGDRRGASTPHPARPRRLHPRPRPARLRRPATPGLPPRRRPTSSPPTSPAARRPGRREGARVELAGLHRARRRRRRWSCSATARRRRAASTCSATPARPGPTASASCSSSPSSLGVIVHGGLRCALPRGRRAPQSRTPPGAKEYVFGRYERLWHWTMALSGIAAHRHRPRDPRRRAALAC